MVAGRSKNKARSAPATPEQHQDVDLHEEGDESGEEDHQDEQVSTVSLQKEVKDLSDKLNKVLGAVAKLTQQTSAPGLLQEAVGAQSAPGSVSGDSNSSESPVPVYSGDQHDTKRELDRLKQLCAKHEIDTSTRKQKEERKGEQCAAKGGRAAKRVPAASTAPPAADDAAAVADA